MSQAPRSILFVCLGNICRSPLAEAAMRAEAERRGLDLVIDSAGTGAWHIGNPPDRRAQTVARAHGVDVSGLRARQITPADFRRFDLILGLDRSNVRDLEAMAPADGTAEVGLPLDAAQGRGGEDVRDPYYGPDSGFEETWSDVSSAAAAIADRIASMRARQAPRADDGPKG